METSPAPSSELEKRQTNSLTNKINVDLSRINLIHIGKKKYCQFIIFFLN